MGNSLSSALLGAGLVSREQVGRQEEREKTVVGQNIGRLKGKSASGSLMNLGTIKTVGEFKKVAREILTDNHDTKTVAEVVRLAHNLQAVDGGKKLVWLILQIRNNLSKVRTDKKEQIIKRALRSSNPTTDIPPDWLAKK